MVITRCRDGRPNNDPELVAAEQQQFIDDQRQRNAVEGQIGQGKRRYGLGLIREKLLAYWLQHLLGNEPGKGSRSVHLNHQAAPHERQGLTDQHVSSETRAAAGCVI